MIWLGQQVIGTNLLRLVPLNIQSDLNERFMDIYVSVQRINLLVHIPLHRHTKYVEISTKKQGLQYTIT